MPAWQTVVLLFITYVVVPRLSFLPKNVHSLLIVFGPFLLPRLLNAFNTARATSRSIPIRPTPLKVQRTLNLLFVSTVVSLGLSLAYFGPENIYLKTQSRMGTDVGVLFTRLKHLRPLGEEDEALRSKFLGATENRLIYLAYGPDTLINCIWCTTSAGNDQQNYFLYHLPKIIVPHIAHLAVIGLATSSLVGPEGSRFRTHATIAGLLLMASEAWYLGTYDITSNKRARLLQDMDFAHWRIRFLRYISFALTDMSFGIVLWLTSTNRWLVKPASIAERLEMATRDATETMNRLRGLGVITNSINRNAALRGFKDEYWQTDGKIKAEIVQEEEVVQSINRAVGKINMEAMQGEAGKHADSILERIDGLRTSQVLAAEQQQREANEVDEGVEKPVETSSS